MRILIYIIFLLILIIISSCKNPTLKTGSNTLNFDSIARIQKHIIVLDSLMIELKINNYTIKDDSLRIKRKVFSLSDPSNLFEKNGEINIAKKKLYNEISFLYESGLYEYTSFISNVDAIDYIKLDNSLQFNNMQLIYEKVVVFGRCREICFLKENEYYGLYYYYHKNSRKAIELFFFENRLSNRKVWDIEGRLIFEY